MSSLPPIFDTLKVKVIEPIGEHKSTLIWMHGLGDSSDGFYSMFKSMAPKHTKILLPNAPMRPITVNGGYVMRGWYDIKSFEDRSEAMQDIEGIVQSCKLVHELFDVAFSETSTVVCGGFSQGGSLTLAAALSYEKHALEALIVASGIALLGKSLLGDRYKTVQDNVPIYIFHGKMDNIIQYSHAMNSYKDLLETRGSTVQMFVEQNQRHEISQSQYGKLVELIEKHCCSRS